METPKIRPRFADDDESAVTIFTVVVVPMIGDPPIRTPAAA
jgi:hypothetical protein